MQVEEIKGLGESRVEYLEGYPIEVYEKYAFLVRGVRFGNIAISDSPSVSLEKVTFLYSTMKTFEKVKEDFDSLKN